MELLIQQACPMRETHVCKQFFNRLRMLSVLPFVVWCYLTTSNHLNVLKRFPWGTVMDLLRRDSRKYISTQTNMLLNEVLLLSGSWCYSKGAAVPSSLSQWQALPLIAMDVLFLSFQGGIYHGRVLDSSSSTRCHSYALRCRSLFSGSRLS